MGVAIHVLLWLACLQVAQMYPMQADPDPAFEDLRLAKRHSMNPFKESLLSSLGFYEGPKEGPSQRKKAVDSTFIRFGRSSMPDGMESLDNLPSSSASTGPYFADKEDEGVPRSMDDRLPQEVINSLSNLHGLKLEDCRVTSRRDLVRLLLTNGNCLLKKNKRARPVNDTFIRFGKREAPNSGEVQPSAVSAKGSGR